MGATDAVAAVVVCLALAAPAAAQPAVPVAPAANANLRLEFHVRFVQQDTAYLDGGWAAGLAEGMKLVVKGSDDRAVAELVIVGLAQTSAVAEIHDPTRAIVPGDAAFLSGGDVQARVEEHAIGATRKYPAVISFTEGGNALDEEAHADVPRPPLPSTNRARGRIGFDYFEITSRDTSKFRGRDAGAMLQADFTRIGGSHWSLNGYWRGRLNSTSSASQQTLQDLINRTYHLSLEYDNPEKAAVAGIGRLYLPWATSLDTLDGGYIGARLSRGVIAGVFGGSSPDPTSYDYNPGLERGGAFLNVQGGRFDAVHYSSTAGAGVDLVQWSVNRPFLFFENSVSAGHGFSIYHALQADSPRGNDSVPAPGAGIGRSFLTVRWAPVPRIQLDGNDTFFRDVPTFDAQLVGTGLLDKYLFQGVSGGAHVEALKGFTVYAELGKSSRSGDTTSALNTMYGATFAKLPGLGIKVDGHASRFTSAFGTGNYRALSVTRNLADGFRLDVLAGDQTFDSATAGSQSSRFLTTTVDASVGPLVFVNGAFTLYRGALQNYNQLLFTVGYRFDSKRVRR